MPPKAHEWPVRTLDEVVAACRFMADFPGPWWLVGGWAADAWAGEPSREHEDIEFGLRRCDQEIAFALCAGWQFYTPVDDQWAPMALGERLRYPAAMLQVRRTPDSVVPVDGMPPEFEFLLNEVEGDEWVFQRDPSIRLALDRVYERSPLGVPVVVPHVLLLYKSLYHRPKDEHDFRLLRGRLTADQRAWLRTQITRLRPADPWLPHLTDS